MHDHTAGRTGPDISVVIATHSEQRRALLERTLASVRQVARQPIEVIVAVDHNPELATVLRATCEGVRIVEHVGRSGASGTRNAGAAEARGAILVFIDDDAVARPGWLEALTAPLRDPSVVGTGGRTMAAWEGQEPRWFPLEFGWVVGASHAGLPVEPARVRNVWSENMAIHRDAFERVGGFRLNFGKVGNVSRPEDTDLCIRVGAAEPERSWVYVPSAVVDHFVSRGRGTFSFFLKRCYWEGAGKIELSDHLNGFDAFGDERAYLLSTLPRALVRDITRGDLRRAGAVVAGVCAAAAGGAVSLARAWRDAAARRQGS